MEHLHIGTILIVTLKPWFLFILYHPAILGLAKSNSERSFSRQICENSLGISEILLPYEVTEWMKVYSVQQNRKTASRWELLATNSEFEVKEGDPQQL